MNRETAVKLFAELNRGPPDGVVTGRMIEAFATAVESQVTASSLREKDGQLFALRTELERMQHELVAVRAQLRLATGGLRHCAGWNIHDDKRKALMSVVVESESMLASRWHCGGGLSVVGG